MSDPRAAKNQPPIYYGCTELFYNRRNDEDNDQNTHVWMSTDGEYFADRFYRQIVVSEKDGNDRQGLVAIPEDISQYSDVYVDLLHSKKVRLFKKGREVGTETMIDDYLSSPCIEKKQPTIYYGCTELFYNRENDEKSSWNLPAWVSADGNYYAKRAYLQIIVYQKKDDNAITGLPEDISQYSAVYIDPNPSLSKNGREAGTGKTIYNYVPSSCLDGVDGEHKTPPEESKLLNTGTFNIGLDSANGLTLQASEKIGGLAEHPDNLVLGLEATAFYNRISEGDVDYFTLNPLNAFLDIAFKAHRSSAYDSQNGIVLRGGFFDDTSNYGYTFPMLGGGADVYFRTDPDDNEVPVLSGKVLGRFGVMGGIDVASSEAYESFETIYEDNETVGLYYGSLALSLEFDSGAQLGLEGLYGHIDKEDDYIGNNWSGNDDGPDVYNNFYGVSPNFRMRSGIFRMSAAYYYLNKDGGEDYSFIGGSVTVDQKITNASHRIRGDMSLRAVEEGDFKFDVGFRGNYYTSDRKDYYDNSTIFGEPAPMAGGDSQTNLWNKNRSYANLLFRFIYKPFTIELGGGYSEGFRSYTSPCEGWDCEPSSSGSEDGLNGFLDFGLDWGNE